MLHLLRDGVPRTRAELATVTECRAIHVAARLDALLDADLVVQEKGAFTGGRPAEPLHVQPRRRIVIAADLGATHAPLAVTDLGGNVAGRDGAVDSTSPKVPRRPWTASSRRPATC